MSIPPASLTRQETWQETWQEENLQPSFAAQRGMDPKLLELLVCPVTKTALSFDAMRGELVSVVAKLAYPIREGIPIMLPEEARRLEDL